MSITLLDHLVNRFPAASRTTLKRMVETGRVRINGRVATKFKQPVEPTDIVRISDRAISSPARKPPRPPALDIIHEDPDLLVVNKPPGLLTSTVPREPRATLLALVRQHVAAHDPAARVGLVHRLDRDASGLLVFSKNPAAYAGLKDQFFRHTVERIYTAVVAGNPKPPAGRIASRLVERADGSVHSTKHPGKAELAITHYTVLRTVPASHGSLSLLRVTLETGRKHQIRVHLSERGWPIVNDPVYNENSKPNGRLMLAATQLTLTHPRTGQRRTFEISPPAEMLTPFRSGKPGAKPDPKSQ